MTVLMQVLQGTDWTLVTALCTAVAALTTVVGILWWRYNGARDKYEELLQNDRDDLVPIMIRLSETATTLNTNATKLIEESIKLRTYRRGDHADRETRA